MKSWKILLCSLAVVLQAACVTMNPASSGMKVSDEAMTSIRNNVDTKNTVLAKLGQPTRKTAKDGRDYWFYDFRVMGSNLKITEQETTTFEFNTNTSVLLAHYKGAPSTTGVPAGASSTRENEGDDWCQKAVYKPIKNQLSKEKLDNLYQKCVRSCKNANDKYLKYGSDKDYAAQTFQLCASSYLPGDLYYSEAQRGR